MADTFKIRLQVADGHLRLEPRGTLSDLEIRQILRVTEAGLHVFPVVIVDLQRSQELEANALALLEDGLRRLIAERKQVLLNVNDKGPGKRFLLS
jgi:hypothetical protein